MDLILQPVIPDASGNYEPGNATGYMVQQSTGVVYTETGTGTSFTLKMSGIAPNYITMKDVKFIEGTTPDSSEVYGPAFGTPFVSTPCSFTISPAVPSFLIFNTDSGTIQPNGQQIPSTPSSTSETLSITNALGTEQVKFSIDVSAA